MHMAQNAFARCAEKVNTRKNLTLNRQAVGEVVSYCTMIAANDTLDFNRDKQERLCTEMNHRAEVYTVEMSAYGQPKAREKLRERTAPWKKPEKTMNSSSNGQKTGNMWRIPNWAAVSPR